VWTDATDDASWPYGKAFSDRVTQDAVCHHGSLVQITVHADPTWLSARVGHAPGNRRHLPVCAG